MGEEEWRREKRIIIGGIFCRVVNTKADGQSTPLITWGNQRWQGGIPSFRRSDSKIKLLNKKGGR